MRLLFLVASLVAAVPAVRGQLYLQCANVAIQIALFPAVLNIITTLLSPANSYAGCPAYCIQQGGYTYSLYQPGTGIFNVLGTCYCVNGDPTGGYVLSGTDSSGSCGLASFQINYLPTTSFTFTGCDNGSGSYSGGLAATTLTSEAACIARCTGYKYMVTDFNPFGAAAFSCACPNVYNAGPAATCGTASNFVYFAAGVISGGTRRRRAVEAANALDVRNSPLCPRGLTACQIAGAEDSYECLYTPVELESCGGCTNGYAGNVTGPVGQDCTKLAGTSPKGVSCIQSRCVASSCLNGYKLFKGRCVPLLTV